MKRLFLLLTIMLAAACTQPSAPLVGITCSRNAAKNVSPNAYSNAVTKAGGVAVILPTVSTEAEASALMSRLDGLLLSGGVDVSPEWYGEEVLNETVKCDPVRDRSDSLLLAAALKARKPVLAICRGAQLANVFLGGTLYQDIPSQLPGNIGHGGGTSHLIGLEQESFLARTYGTDSLEVNSYHHQCVKDLGDGITVTARAADGIVEAWEAPGITAVQFHPEKMLANGGDWLPFFRAWIATIPRR